MTRCDQVVKWSGWGRLRWWVRLARRVAAVTPGWCYLAGDGQSGSVVSQNSSHRVYFNGPPASS